jgi:hypothetical protein
MPGRIGPYPEGMYGIFAELKVYLVEESGTKEPADAFVGRVEKHIERGVESLAASDFLTKVRGVFGQAGMKHVIMMDKNDITIFDSDEESQEDWGQGFNAALDAESSSGGKGDWWILVSGWNEEFKFRQDVTFKHKHTLATPSIAFVIRALPAEWGRGSGEDFDAWLSRLQSTLGNKQSVKEEEIRVRPKIEKYLEDYKQLLKGAFAVRDFSQSLNINLSGIDLESFKANYSAEQGP